MSSSPYALEPGGGDGLVPASLSSRATVDVLTGRSTGRPARSRQ